MSDALILLSQFNLESPLPTIFEIFAANFLNQNLRDFFLYAHHSLVERFPARLAATSPYANELYYAFWCIIETAYVNRCSSSFTESFFALRRAGLKNRVKLVAAAPASAPSAGGASDAGVGGAPPVAGASSVSSSSGSSNTTPLSPSGLPLGEEPFGKSLRFTPTLTRRQRWFCYAQLLLVPYLNDMLGERYEYYTDDTPDVVQERVASVRSRVHAITREQQEVERLSFVAAGADPHPASVAAYNTACSRLRRLKILHKLHKAYVRLLVTLFPVLSLVTKGVQLGFITGYALEKTPFSSLMHYLGGYVSRRATKQESAASSAGKGWGSYVIRFAGTALTLIFIAFRYVDWQRGRNTGVSLVRSTVNAGNSLHTMGTGGGGATGGGGSNLDDTAKVKPPKDMKPLPGDVKEGDCIVCKRPVVNAAVSIVSGAVGCFSCMTQAVQETKKDPLTSQTCLTVHIRRLYES